MKWLKKQIALIRSRTLIEKLAIFGIATAGLLISFIETNHLYYHDGYDARWYPTDALTAFGIICIFILIIFGTKKEDKG